MFKHTLLITITLLLTACSSLSQQQVDAFGNALATAQTIAGALSAPGTTKADVDAKLDDLVSRVKQAQQEYRDARDQLPKEALANLDKLSIEVDKIIADIDRSPTPLLRGDTLQLIRLLVQLRQGVEL